MSAPIPEDPRIAFYGLDIPTPESRIAVLRERNRKLREMLTELVNILEADDFIGPAIDEARELITATEPEV